MFEGKEIEHLIELFESRRVSLFHACQILDFRSYLRLGVFHPMHASKKMDNVSPGSRRI